MAKKAPLTKEEKAAKKLLAKQRAEEAKRQARMEHLEREMALAEESWKKLKRQFKDMLLKMQMPTIRHDIEVLWHSYDSALDRKDYVIEKLLTELDERELLRERNFAEQAAALSKLIALKEERVEEAQRRFDREREDVLLEHEEKTADKEDERSATRAKFSLVGGAMTARADEAMIALRSDYVLRFDDERDKMNDMRKLLKVMLENRLDAAWRELRKTLSDYEASAEDRRKRLAAMSAEDARSSAILERQEQRVLQLQATDEHMRWRLAHEEPEQMLRGRIAEQRYFNVAYCALRVRLESDRKHDERQLARLSVISNDTLEKLQRLVAKGQRLLTLASGCRALETIEEAISPIPHTHQDSSPVGAEAFAISRLSRRSRHLPASDSDYDDDIEVTKSASSVVSEASSLSSAAGSAESASGALMAGFWRRVARADGARADMLATLHALRFEQRSIKRALHCCLRDVAELQPPADPRACADACYGANKMDPLPVGRRNVVEASHIYRNLL